jgi:ligand-binding SRPBCC domain-containing protein
LAPQAFFEATPTGTKMTDVVHYGLPLGILGRIMNTLVVKNKLKSIFEYRVTKVDELFNKSNEQASCFLLVQTRFASRG